MGLLGVRVTNAWDEVSGHYVGAQESPWRPNRRGVCVCVCSHTGTCVWFLMLPWWVRPLPPSYILRPFYYVFVAAVVVESGCGSPG